MKRIVFLLEDFRFGGVEISLINLLNNIDFQNKNYCVTVLNYGTHNDVLHKLNKNDRIAVKNVNNAFLRAFEKILAKIIGSEKSELICNKILRYSVVRHIQRKKYDVVIRYHHASIKTLFTRLKKRKNQKFIAWYHRDKPTEYYLNEAYLENCDKVVVVADGNKANIEQGMPYLKEKLYVVENLIPYDEIKERSKSEERMFNQDNFNILTVGRIDYEKGFELAIEVLVQLRKYIPNCKWYVVGNVAEDRKEYDEYLRKLIKENGLEDDFVFLGGKENPYTYMRQCDLYVQPSQFESFGITMAEAQVCGCAVAATDTVGTRLLIEDGRTGVVCRYSCEELTEAITELYNSPQKMSYLRENAKNIDFEERNQKVMEKFYALIDGE